MKLKHLFLTVILLCGCAETEIRKEEPLYESADFTAVVVSDLHYTSTPSAFNSIVPLEPLGTEVTDALINEVIGLSPDAFIMTGDNTNNGKEEDVKELALKLKKIRDAGIEVILTTGNHDYGQRTMQPYETYLLPLLNMEEKDSSSYSYLTHHSGVAIYAMDDSHAGASDGYFKEETMAWLKERLKREKNRILFLSHHNILSGIAEPMYQAYLIQNEDLLSSLESAGVRLCMSGHQHNQAVYEYKGMYEILNGMPYSSAHTYGFLKMDDEGVFYETRQIDLQKYGEQDLKEKADMIIARQSEAFSSTFVKLCEEKNLSEEEKADVISLIGRFFEAYNRGELSETADDILNDPSYAKMQEVLMDKNYGPWMEGLLKNPPGNGSFLSFRWDEYE